MPALYIGHGAPPLVDDAKWVQQLKNWSAKLPRPKAILVASAHWESAPLSIGATETVPLVYDFYGFDQKYYDVTYTAPGAPDLAAQIEALMPDHQEVAHEPNRGLDHGAYVPLTVMYPEADIPVLQISLPTLNSRQLFELGKRLKPLRDQGVLVIGSGFLTHGLPFINWRAGVNQKAPGWSADFDSWANEALRRGDIEELLAYSDRAPALGYAHPTVEHLAPMFLTLGAADDPESSITSEIEGFWLGLAKRSFAVA